MTRSYGSHSTLCATQEDTYGTKPNGNWEKFSFISSDLSSEQGLVSSELLGNGREPGTPFRDVIKDEGNIVVPIEARDFGRWLQFLLGDPTSEAVAASGSISFTKNPGAKHVLVINGIEWVFITEESKDRSIHIGNNLAATLDNLATALNASTDAKIKCATYTVVDGAKLNIVYDTVGTAGNSFTFETKDSATATVSGATLSGSGYAHTFTSGATNLPSFSLEIGHTNIPAYFVHTGCMLNSMAFNFQRSGVASCTLAIIAQAETRYQATQGREVTSREYKPFSQFSGKITRNGAPLANVTGAEFTYSNGMEAVQTIRSDGLIECVDPSTVSITGTIEARFGDTILLDDAITGTPVELEMGYTADNFSLIWTFHEVYLPKPKVPISGPGGVQTTFNWQGAISKKLAKSVTVVLKNDISNYA